MSSQQSPIGYYPQAPCAAVGAVVFKDERVLLVRRGKAPAREQWAIPGGSVMLGESLQQAVEREVFEETGIRISAGKPAYVFDVVDQMRRRLDHASSTATRAEAAALAREGDQVLVAAAIALPARIRG